MSALGYVGYSTLRRGRIHMLCPSCGRKQSNGYRDKLDPPSAVVASFLCDRCDSGTKDGDARYRDAQGRELCSFCGRWQCERAEGSVECDERLIRASKIEGGAKC